MLPWTHGQESKLRSGKVSGRIGLQYEMYKKILFSKESLKPSTMTNFFFINLIFGFLFSLQVFLP